MSFYGKKKNVVKFILFTFNKQLLPGLVSAHCFTSLQGLVDSLSVWDFLLGSLSNEVFTWVQFFGSVSPTPHHGQESLSGGNQEDLSLLSSYKCFKSWIYNGPEIKSPLPTQ